MSVGAAIRGVVGQIKWSYYAAAAVRDYTVTRSPRQEWSLRATIVEADAYKMAQRPLIFVAPHKQGDWRWPIESVHTEYGVVTAKLGPPLP